LPTCKIAFGFYFWPQLLFKKLFSSQQLNPSKHMESVIFKSDNFFTDIFDTLLLSKRLKQSKFTEEQAELLSEILKVSHEGNLAEVKAMKAELASIKTEAKEEAKNIIKDKELATKQDLSITEKSLELKIEQVKSSLEVKIEQVRSDLIRWVAGLLLVQTGLLFTLIKVFLIK